MSPGLPPSALAEAIDRTVAPIEPQFVARRRDLHRHPEPAWRPADGECGYDVTVNDAALTETMLPTLRRVAGADRVITVPKVTGSEDFSCYQQVVPGMFLFVGVTPADRDPERAEPNHSPRFVVDEAALPLGVRALAQLACDRLEAPEEARRPG